MIMLKKICSQDSCSMTHHFFKDSDVIDFCLFVLMIFDHQGSLLNIFVIFFIYKNDKSRNLSKIISWYSNIALRKSSKSVKP